jgi:hypothetical protein
LSVSLVCRFGRRSIDRVEGKRKTRGEKTNEGKRKKRGERKRTRGREKRGERKKRGEEKKTRGEKTNEGKRKTWFIVLEDEDLIG